MSFKDISYLELWWSFVQWSGTICAILVNGIMRNNLCEIILNLEQGFWRRCFKIFLIWSSCSLFVQQSGTICAILVEGIIVTIL